MEPPRLQSPRPRALPVGWGLSSDSEGSYALRASLQQGPSLLPPCPLPTATSPTCPITEQAHTLPGAHTDSVPSRPLLPPP